jgi:hypothetical protein
MRVLPLLVLLGGCDLFRRPGTDPDRTGTADYGEDCAITDDCLSPYVCSGMGACVYSGEPGAADVGADCVSSSYCQAGLACTSAGVCAEEGSPGTAGTGESCDDTSDCRLGYGCIDDACYGFDLPLWTGATCNTETGAFRLLFEVGPPPGDDFYRLPFPNDARVVAGRLDLTGHPSPGPLVAALGDVVGDVLQQVSDDFDGFGTNQAVLARFSGELDFDTLEFGLPAQGGTVALVGLTPGSPDYGRSLPAAVRADGSRGAYICQDWIGVYPTRPLRPHEVYAVVYGSALSGKDGTAIAQDADFAAMLGATAPADSDLVAAWNSYAPLRAWLTASGQANTTFAGAAVFTTQDPTDPALAVRQAVEIGPIPAAQGLILCGDDPGPYADADDPTRGCHGTDAGFDEVQGTLDLPQYQAGTPPFKDRDDGGGIDTSGGAPSIVRTEAVQFVLTVPTTEMPANGWPLVIYAHGTGGNDRSAIDEGLADQLSAVTLDDSTVVHFATLTIDALDHGPRRHLENAKQSWLDVDPDAYDPDVLFYNPLNPRAARDNALQSVADAWAVAKFAAVADWDGAHSPTGDAVRFDPNRTYYLGHSQGATTGVIAIAYGEEFSAGVLSAAGGLLIESLLHKTNPHDLPAMIRVGLADPDIDRYHPLLNIAQMAGERSDGINHAIHVLRDPLGGVPLSVLQITGHGDTYTPDQTQFPLAIELGVDQCPIDGADAIEGPTVASPPVSGNVDGATGIVALYDARGRDAHFVLFDRDDAMKQMTQFLGTAARDGVPTFVAP